MFTAIRGVNAYAVALLPFDNQSFWVALFGWYAVCGAGPAAVDSLLRRGLADSALPIIPHVVNFTESLHSRCCIS